jgi:stage V sporulation protein B
MDKAMDMGKSSATGSFHMLIGVAGSTVIMALGTLILGWLLSRDQLGLYGVAVIPASMINFFRDWGVNAAMTKEIAHLRAEGREAEIHDVIVSGVVFEVISGAILSIVCFVLAGTLATILKMPDAAPLISLTSVSIFAGAITAAAGNIFVGFEKMKLNSVTTILTAVVKTSLGPLLVVLGYGAFGATIAYSASILVGGVIGISIVYVAFFRPLSKLKVGKCNIRKTLKPMLAYGVPLTVSNTVVGVLPLLFAFIMASIAGTSLMGDYYAGTYFAVLLSFFTIPISTALFPTFAKVDAKKEPELLKTVFASSVKYTSLLVVPATIMIMVLSHPMVNTLWPNKFPYAPLFLTLTAVINLWVIFGNISLGSLMTGIGETRKLMVQSFLSLAFSLPLVGIMFLYSTVIDSLTGMIIGIVGIVVAGLPGLLWGLVWVWKKYGVKADLRVSAKIFSASAIAGLTTFLFLSVFNTSAVLRLIAGFVLFLLVFLAATPLIGAVNQADVDNMRSMFSGLGVVSKVLDLLLKIMEKPLKLRKKKLT